MDISRWSIDGIMQLPDWCFGRRWFVGCYCGDSSGDVAYYKVQENLPDWFVVWGIMLSCRSPAPVNVMRATIRLSDHVPASVEDAKAMDRLCKGISTPDILYEFYVSQWDLTWVPVTRIITESKGRSLAFVTNGDQVTAYEMTIGVLISGVPREVPDWVVSGLAGMR